MIDIITRYVSAISLAIVVTLSLFNVGYFWKVGLHFMGLSDLTNLVYSLGISLSVVSIGATLTALITNLRNSNWKLFLIIGAGLALLVWGIFHLVPRSSQPQLIENLAILTGSILSGAAYAVFLSRDPRNLGNWRNLSVLTLVWLVISFQAGMCQAAIELSDRFTYVISTKTGNLYGARILRSSSSGFLIAIGGRTTFVPNGEIKQVTSDHIE